MKTLKEMKTEIRNLAERTPDRQFRTGYLLKTVGTKFITIIDLYNSSLEKIEILAFYNKYC